VKVSTFLIKEKDFFWGERGKIIFGKKMICYYVMIYYYRK